MGNLINAVSIFDVFFALDADQRFGLNKSQSGLQSDIAQSPVLNRYADRRRAIVAAKQVWKGLRSLPLWSSDCEHASALMRAERGDVT
jgi:hypothetical protein